MSKDNTIVCTCPKPKEEPKIPRPRNAFILFRMSNQHSFPPSVSSRDKSKIIASTWNRMSQQEKEYWDGLAAEERKKHKLMYPNYVYNKPKALRGKNGKKSRRSSIPCTCFDSNPIPTPDLESPFYQSQSLNSLPSPVTTPFYNSPLSEVGKPMMYYQPMSGYNSTYSTSYYTYPAPGVQCSTSIPQQQWSPPANYTRCHSMNTQAMPIHPIHIMNHQNIHAASPNQPRLPSVSTLFN